MGQQFIHDDFLLHSDEARELYHKHASRMPIIDYHCHLSPAWIAENHQFSDITELWLSGDHYKWRAMRANGVPEKYITGDSTAREKFAAWARTVPYTMRNPLYHWTAMELKTAFGIDEMLTPESADRIFDECNRQLSRPEMSAQSIIKKYNVEIICTTDDPIDSLEHHRTLVASNFGTKVYPTWRPDKVLAGAPIEAYNEYIAKLAQAADMEITGYSTLIDALQKRLSFFATQGCRVADHGLAKIPWAPCTDEQADALFKKMLSGKALNAGETEMFNTHILLDLCRMNARAGWAQQFHFGAIRNVNTLGYKALGPDTGYDTICDWLQAENLSHILDALNVENLLAKTILYNINPSDNVWVATMIGTFQDGMTPGKIQMGSGWWFNDQLQGMRAQMNALSTQGLLSRFVGMLTDSRSFVSYPRHEYFRRLLCDMIGDDIKQGLISDSQWERITGMIEDICYNNAKNYFNF